MRTRVRSANIGTKETEQAPPPPLAQPATGQADPLTTAPRELTCRGTGKEDLNELPCDHACGLHDAARRRTPGSTQGPVRAGGDSVHAPALPHGAAADP